MFKKLWNYYSLAIKKSSLNTGNQTLNGCDDFWKELNLFKKNKCLQNLKKLVCTISNPK